MNIALIQRIECSENRHDVISLFKDDVRIKVVNTSQKLSFTKVTVLVLIKPGG